MRKEVPEPVANLWRYPLRDGWEAWAGKTDEDNDILSLRLARPEDFWFHAASVPGSHVVLRAPDGCSEAPDRTLMEAAAAIAAFHSKARNAGRTSVVCCKAKQVGKERGAKSGTVTISHEKIIHVRPALPLMND